MWPISFWPIILSMHPYHILVNKLKVVDNPCPLQSLTWDCQPLPAYQYFENVRNFLVAAKELNLPTFEASDLERVLFHFECMFFSVIIIWVIETWNNDWTDQDTFEAKVVDCVLALKCFHESKQMSNENGFHKHVKSPLPLRSSNRMHPRPLSTVSLDSCRRLDMSATCEKWPPVGSEELEGLTILSYLLCYCRHSCQVNEMMHRR